jgi:hypothetical protein
LRGVARLSRREAWRSVASRICRRGLRRGCPLRRRGGREALGRETMSRGTLGRRRGEIRGRVGIVCKLHLIERDGMPERAVASSLHDLVPQLAPGARQRPRGVRRRARLRSVGCGTPLRRVGRSSGRGPRRSSLGTRRCVPLRLPARTWRGNGRAARVAESVSRLDRRTAVGAGAHGGPSITQVNESPVVT